MCQSHAEWAMHRPTSNANCKAGQSHIPVQTMRVHWPAWLPSTTLQATKRPPSCATCQCIPLPPPNHLEMPLPSLWWILPNSHCHSRLPILPLISRKNPCFRHQHQQKYHCRHHSCHHTTTSSTTVLTPPPPPQPLPSTPYLHYPRHHFPHRQ